MTAPDGSAATCVSLTPGGGLSFTCRGCDVPGYQPFAGTTVVAFWIRAGGGNDTTTTTNNNSTALPLKIFLLNDSTKEYCGAEPKLADVAPAAYEGGGGGGGGWARYELPIASFDCKLPLERLTRVELQNIGGGDEAAFCLADLELVK